MISTDALTEGLETLLAAFPRYFADQALMDRWSDTYAAACRDLTDDQWRAACLLAATELEKMPPPVVLRRTGLAGRILRANEVGTLGDPTVIARYQEGGELAHLFAPGQRRALTGPTVRRGGATARPIAEYLPPARQDGAEHHALPQLGRSMNIPSKMPS